MGELRPLLQGLVFPEGPRWHDGKLWFSDMHAHQVRTVDLDGIVEMAETIAEIYAESGQPTEEDRLWARRVLGLGP